MKKRELLNIIKKQELFLHQKTEIWAYRYNGVWYELHVDSTEERKIFEIFSEKNDIITDEIRSHLEDVVGCLKKIN